MKLLAFLLAFLMTSSALASGNGSTKYCPDVSNSWSMANNLLCAFGVCPNGNSTWTLVQSTNTNVCTGGHNPCVTGSVTNFGILTVIGPPSQFVYCNFTIDPTQSYPKGQGQFVIQWVTPNSCPAGVNTSWSQTLTIPQGSTGCITGVTWDVYNPNIGANEPMAAQQCLVPTGNPNTDAAESSTFIAYRSDFPGEADYR